MAIASLAYTLPRLEDPDLEFEKYLNLLVALMDRRAGEDVVRATPYELTIDPSTTCQLSCPYCELGNGTIRRPRALLDPALHERMLDQVGRKAFIGWYFSTGEPLLNKRLPEVLSQARARGIFTIVSTNLSLPLTDERIDALLRSGLGVLSVSIDGASPETYRRYRSGGDFALVIGNVRRILARRAALGLREPLVEWRFLVFRHNAHEVPEARRHARELGVDLLEFFPGYAPPDAPDGAVQRTTEPLSEPIVSGPALDRAKERRDAPLRMLAPGASGGRRDGPIPPEILHRKCDWLYFGTTLFPSGAVSPCCVSNNAPDDFGAITDETPFAAVWNNANFREARRSFAHGERTGLVCARCPNTDAQDLQFAGTLRAVLSNAPAWVVRILARDPDRFFRDVDLALLGDVLEALRIAAGRVPRTPDALDRLGQAAATSEDMREPVLLLRRLLEESQRPSGARAFARRLLDALRGVARA
jgi:MoaA/NifB/PqqE/SkfB family radical SAM enzyme